MLTSAVSAILLTGAAYLPAMAQNEDSPATAAAYAQADAGKKPTGAPEKKATAKKKGLKRKKVRPQEQPSEYKFQAPEVLANRQANKFS